MEEPEKSLMIRRLFCFSTKLLVGMEKARIFAATESATQ